MTLTEIQESYKDSYFSQVHKWGYNLTEEDAITVGLLQVKIVAPKDKPEKETPIEPKATKVTKKTPKGT